MGLIKKLHDEILEQHNFLNAFKNELKDYCKSGEIYYDKYESCILVYVRFKGIEKLSRHIGEYSSIASSSMTHELNSFLLKIGEPLMPLPEINTDIFVDNNGNKYDIPFDKLIEFGAIEAIK